MYKQSKRTNLNFGKLFKRAFLTVLFVYTFIFIRWIVVDVYKPKEKNYIFKSKLVYLILQDELSDFYVKNGFIYDNTTDTQDKFCEVLKKKYSTLAGDCNVGDRNIEQQNIEFRNGKMTIHGFSNPPYYLYGVLVKDLFIDVNGAQGENIFGIDRVPVRIYSNGKMGGMISPINCNKDDYDTKGVPYSDICPADISINFMDTKIPFSYNVMQIGGKRGRSRILNNKVSYLRADCVAFGGELIGAIDYCDYKNYHWLTACYHEYRCAIGMGRKDKIRPNREYVGKDSK